MAMAVPSSEKISIGMMQGRLSAKPSQPLQSFPLKTWRDEFSSAASIGFDLIEWLVDGDNDGGNPIASADGRSEILDLSDRHGVGVRTLCAHSFIDGQLLTNGNVANEALDHFIEVLDWAGRLDIQFVVLPAMDAMSLQPQVNRDRLAVVLEKALSGPGPEVLLESDLSAQDLSAFVKDIGHERLGVLYDLGNANAMNFDIQSDLARLGQLVREVHMKDRSMQNGPSHRLGKGSTRFSQAGEALQSLRWQGPVVLETPVFEDWQTEARHNFSFTRQWLDSVESLP